MVDFVSAARAFAAGEDGRAFASLLPSELTGTALDGRVHRMVAIAALTTGTTCGGELDLEGEPARSLIEAGAAIDADRIHNLILTNCAAPATDRLLIDALVELARRFGAAERAS